MYKVLADNTIVGVIESPSYVRYQMKNNRLISCAKEYAQGIVSDDGSTVWHLEGSAIIPFGDYRTVTLVEISEEEYNILKDVIEPDTTKTNLSVEEQIQQATLDMVIQSKIKEMSEVCSSTIIGGFDIELTDGKTYHFALTLEDQVNMIELKNLYTSGATQFAYHSSGELCRYYSAEDIALILEKSESFKNYNIVYFNSLKNYIKSLKEISKVSAIEYGVKIPKKYQSEVLKSLA